MEKLQIIVNTGSRTGQAASVWHTVKEILCEKEITYKAYLTKYKGHATKLAQKFSELEDEKVNLIVLGGDGTINEVLNGITDFEKVRLGVIPTGSGNDFGTNLGLLKDPKEALEEILMCITREGEDIPIPRMDLGKVIWDNGKYSRIFGISSGVGLDALVSKKALNSRLKTVLNAVHLGKLTYSVLTVQSLFSMETAVAEVCYDKKDSVESFPDMIYAAAMNLRSEGGGVPMAPDASCTDGKLSISYAYGIPKWRTFFCFPFLLKAKHTKLKGFLVQDHQKMKMKLGKPMVLHADGEYCSDVTDVEFLCLPDALQILKTKPFRKEENKI